MPNTEDTKGNSEKPLGNSEKPLDLLSGSQTSAMIDAGVYSALKAEVDRLELDTPLHKVLSKIVAVGVHKLQGTKKAEDHVMGVVG